MFQQLLLSTDVLSSLVIHCNGYSVTGLGVIWGSVGKTPFVFRQAELSNETRKKKGKRLPAKQQFTKITTTEVCLPVTVAVPLHEADQCVVSWYKMVQHQGWGERYDSDWLHNPSATVDVRSEAYLRQARQIKGCFNPGINSDSGADRVWGRPLWDFAPWLGTEAVGFWTKLKNTLFSVLRFYVSGHNNNWSGSFPGLKIQ